MGDADVQVGAAADRALYGRVVVPVDVRVVAIAGCWLQDDRPFVELVALDMVDDTVGAASWLVARRQ